VFDRTWCWSKSDVGQQSAIEFQIEKMLDIKWYLSLPEWAEEQNWTTCCTISQRDILTVGIVTLPFLFEGKCVKNKR
jgi:hypothetical protein